MGSHECPECQRTVEQSEWYMNDHGDIRCPHCHALYDTDRQLLDAVLDDIFGRRTTLPEPRMDITAACQQTMSDDIMNVLQANRERYFITDASREEIQEAIRCLLRSYVTREYRGLDALKFEFRVKRRVQARDVEEELANLIG